ncbi:hypothetical protein BRARA_C04563 [Brassica rapa]|uniref:Protein kinase domain-containing protein n=1 Tax=Brassica campestris TaxID=3711 RepID=A0A398ABS3_BRACM|nr:hypothetical protein BRARA_C04563 [Brassica rapa]
MCFLDDDFYPKLPDFGLAREGPGGDKTHVTTALTFLILAAPEYVDTGYLMTNSDVYSFGVDLYEIITGRRTIERMKPLAEKILVKWVKLYHRPNMTFVVQSLRKIIKESNSENMRSSVGELTKGVMN